MQRFRFQWERSSVSLLPWKLQKAKHAMELKTGPCLKLNQHFEVASACVRRPLTLPDAMLHSTKVTIGIVPLTWWQSQKVAMRCERSESYWAAGLTKL